ncbi:PREDICTED: aldose reductase-like [Habropoda laboriosa]|uniref:aldose reductase-like n=1 Tax=Habropoda laboriosa TaxID=597456 RepID=UPI00083CCAC0|nr:PREDICTED: aldose reductase-like [Habropoda laboriosa]
MMVPSVKFNNGNLCPILGLGTWKSKPNEVTQAVKDAIDIGYRHLDCALFYENEKEVGEAIAAKIKEGVIKREDLFVTSKLWSTYHKPELVATGLQTTLNNLGLEYLDLYLMHSPVGFLPGKALVPKDAEGNILTDDTDYVDTWHEMEKLLKKGLVKNIGISNFNIEQIERLLQKSTIKPVTNQVECHPYLTIKKFSELNNSKGITITAYSPFAAPDRSSGDPNEIVIPKSVTKSRIQENFDIFDFELSPKDMEAVDNLNRNRRVCFKRSGTIQNHKYFPYKTED